MKILLFLLLPFSLFAHSSKAVVVIKSEHQLYLLSDGDIEGKFHIALGANPQGHKHQEGDERTPEGSYLLDYQNPKSSYYKSIHITYPNSDDVSYASAQGVNAGGMIMIHGQRNYFGWLWPITQKFDWSDGCIALSNDEMDKVWDFWEKDIPIYIVW